MKRLNILTLAVSILLGAASFAAVQDSTQHELELSQSLLAARSQGKEEPNQLKELYLLLYHDVVLDIKSEAKDAHLNRDQYIESASSFENFIGQIKAIHLDGMTKPALFNLLIKTEVRLKIQTSIRFMPDGHQQRVDTVSNFIDKVTDLLGPSENKN